MSLPSLNVSNLNIAHINLGTISFNKVDLENIIDVGYLYNLYILAWCVALFVFIQTILISIIFIRMLKMYKKTPVLNHNFLVDTYANSPI